MSRFVRVLPGTDGRFASCSHPVGKLSGRKNGVTSVCPRISSSNRATIRRTMKAVCRLSIAVVIACLLGGHGYAQSEHRPSHAFQPLGVGAIGNGPAVCSPAPCVLPPTLASEG